MTHIDELFKQLRAATEYYSRCGFHEMAKHCGQAADALKAQAAELTKLRERSATVDGDATWNAAIEAAARVAAGLVGEWHSDLADGCAREAADRIRSLKRIK